MRPQRERHHQAKCRKGKAVRATERLGGFGALDRTVWSDLVSNRHIYFYRILLQYFLNRLLLSIAFDTPLHLEIRLAAPVVP